MSSKEKDPDRVRITMQLRTKTGMAYELRGGSFGRVTVHVSPMERDGTKWQVGIDTAGVERIEGTGTTRKEALANAAGTWTQQGVGAFDWDEATVALQAVRAV